MKRHPCFLQGCRPQGNLSATSCNNGYCRYCVLYPRRHRCSCNRWSRQCCVLYLKHHCCSWCRLCCQCCVQFPRRHCCSCNMLYCRCCVQFPRAHCCRCSKRSRQCCRKNRRPNKKSDQPWCLMSQLRSTRRRPKQFVGRR